MKGYVFIDRHYNLNRSMITELLQSDSFRNSGYSIRLNTTKELFLNKWKDLAYGSDETDTLSVLASALHSLNFLPNELNYDGELCDYSDIQKQMSRVGERAVLNSLFCLPDRTNLSSEFGIAQVRPACSSILRQPPHRPIKNGEALSWKTILPDDYWNAIVIADCYILKDRNTIERNLIPIIDKGHARTDRLQITILTEFMKGDRQLMWPGAFKYLQVRYPKANIEIVDVRNASREIHDRNILTNHYMIYVPGGCDLLDSQGCATKRTSIACYRLPQFFDMVSFEFETLCEAYKDDRSNCVKVISRPQKIKNRIIFD